MGEVRERIEHRGVYAFVDMEDGDYFATAQNVEACIIVQAETLEALKAMFVEDIDFYLDDLPKEPQP